MLSVSICKVNLFETQKHQGCPLLAPRTLWIGSRSPNNLSSQRCVSAGFLWQSCVSRFLKRLREHLYKRIDKWINLFFFGLFPRGKQQNWTQKTSVKDGDMFLAIFTFKMSDQRGRLRWHKVLTLTGQLVSWFCQSSVFTVLTDAFTCLTGSFGRTLSHLSH